MQHKKCYVNKGKKCYVKKKGDATSGMQNEPNFVKVKTIAYGEYSMILF